MDDLDRELLGLLRDDARLPVATLAKKLPPMGTGCAP
jgi:DNA-binding Lrp family transcriptional regulator